MHGLPEPRDVSPAMAPGAMNQTREHQRASAR